MVWRTRAEVVSIQHVLHVATLWGELDDQRTDVFLRGELGEFGLDVVEKVGDAPADHLLLEFAVLQEASENEETVTNRVDTVSVGEEGEEGVRYTRRKRAGGERGKKVEICKC